MTDEILTVLDRAALLQRTGIGKETDPFLHMIEATLIAAEATETVTDMTMKGQEMGDTRDQNTQETGIKIDPDEIQTEIQTESETEDLLRLLPGEVRRGQKYKPPRSLQ